MKTQLLATFLTVSASTSFLLAAELPAVTSRMKSFVDSGEIAGAVTLVADSDKILHLSAIGLADIGENQPMKTDSIFWIASMTKPVTATAVMMMQEEGKLSVDDPVSKYLPEFSQLKDPAGNPVSITIRQCLIHSAGLSEVTAAEAETITTLAELMPVILTKTVQFAPGSQWRYSQTGINTAARVVEVVSGKLFPEFLDERLFRPLGMKDTTFYPTEDQVPRIASTYLKGPDHKLEKTPIRFLGEKPVTDRSRYPLANGGLFSTASDYVRFCQMILHQGSFEGKTYLKPESVKLMTTVQSGELKTGFLPGNAWGLGWCIVREPEGVTATLSPGTFGHGGAYGTQAWIDPVKQRIHLLMVQRADFSNSDGSDVRRGFHEAYSQP